MATLEELKAERARRQELRAPEGGATPEQRRVRQIFNAENVPETPIHVEGVPLNQFLQNDRAGRLGALKAERARRQAASPPAGDPRILTDPVPTGIKAIDKEGQTVDAVDFSFMPKGAQRVPALDELPFDDPIRIKADQATQGVDYRRGLPFWQRVQIAASSNEPNMRAAAIQRTLGSNFEQIPDDLPKFRYDTGTQAFQILRPDEEQPGKYRWTSMDGSGLELGDLGDMINLAEIGSLAGGILGTGKGKVFTFGKLSPGKQAALGGLGGGVLGGFGGEGLAIITQYMTTGDTPTVEGLQQLGWDRAKIELFASLTGELGARLLRSASTVGQRTAAAAQGKRGVIGLTDEEIAENNRRLRETQEDLTRVSDVLGREDLPVTEGTATHSIDLIEAENFAYKNAAKKTQRAFNRAQARGRRTTQDYINTVFGGNQRYMGDRMGVLTRANDAIGTNGTITVAQNQDGILGFSYKASPETGLKIKPEHEHWQVRGSLLPENLRGVGMGKDLYIAAADEAAANGKVLVSDIQVSKDALGVWKSLDGTPQFGKLEFNDDIFFNKASQKWESTDGVTPVVRMTQPEPITPKLIEKGLRPARGASGKIVARKELRRFLQRPGKRELGQVLEEVRANPWIEHDLKAAIFTDYEATVQKADGSFSAKAFEEWKDRNARVLDEIFTPAEMMEVRTPGGFRRVLEASEARTASRRNGLATIMGVPTTSGIFKDNKKIWNTLRGLESKKRRRALALLDTTGESGNEIRSLFKEDLKNQLLKKTKGAATESYEEWLADNTLLIQDVLGTQYNRDLRTVGNILKRRSDRAMVIGSGAEANPTALGLTRVIFGPLSRAQRFFSAARKAQVRGASAKVADIVTDPSKLRELQAIRLMPVGSRQVARFIQDNDLAASLGFVPGDGEAFDADNAQHRQQVAELVMALLQEDLNASAVE